MDELRGYGGANGIGSSAPGQPPNSRSVGTRLSGMCVHIRSADSASGHAPVIPRARMTLTAALLPPKGLNDNSGLG